MLRGHLLLMMKNVKGEIILEEKMRVWNTCGKSTKRHFFRSISLVFAILVISQKVAFANTAYVTFYDKNRVGSFDTSNNTIIPGYILVGINPNQITITPDGMTAYLTNFGANSISAIR